MSARRAPPADPDADRDRIEADDDACPFKPEVYNGVDDYDGCPDRRCQGVTHLPDCPALALEFAPGSAALEARHHGDLDRVAETLAEHPTLTRIAMRGSRGADEPEFLGRKRAEAVAHALRARSVAPARILVRYSDTRAREVLLVVAENAAAGQAQTRIVCTPLGLTEVPGESEACRAP